MTAAAERHACAANRTRTRRDCGTDPCAACPVSSTPRAAGSIPTHWVGVRGSLCQAARPRSGAPGVRVWQPGGAPDARSAERAGRGLVLADDAPARLGRSRGSPRRTGPARRSRSSRCSLGDGDRARAAVPRQVALDDGINGTTGEQARPGSSALFLVAGLANWGMTLRADVPHRLGRRAHPRRPAQPPLRPSPAASRSASTSATAPA